MRRTRRVCNTSADGFYWTGWRQIPPGWFFVEVVYEDGKDGIVAACSETCMRLADAEMIPEDTMETKPS